MAPDPRSLRSRCFSCEGGKLYSLRIPVSGKLVDHRTAGISQGQQLGDFVEGLARSVVAGVTDVLVRPAAARSACQIKMSVAARDHQRQHRELAACDFPSAAPPAGPHECGLPDD